MKGYLLGPVVVSVSVAPGLKLLAMRERGRENDREAGFRMGGLTAANLKSSSVLKLARRLVSSGFRVNAFFP